jgi:hypothetical protein
MHFKRRLFGALFAAVVFSSCASRVPTRPWSTAQEVADSVLVRAQRQDTPALVALQLPKALWESHIWPHEELAQQTNSDTAHARMVREFAWQMLQANSHKGMRRLVLAVAEEQGDAEAVLMGTDTTKMGKALLLPSPHWKQRVLGGSLVWVENRWWMLSYANGGSRQHQRDIPETELELEKR